MSPGLKFLFKKKRFFSRVPSFLKNFFLAFWIVSYFIFLSSISAKHCPKKSGLNAFLKTQPASPAGIYSVFLNKLPFLFCYQQNHSPKSQPFLKTIWLFPCLGLLRAADNYSKGWAAKDFCIIARIQPLLFYMPCSLLEN